MKNMGETKEQRGSDMKKEKSAKSTKPGMPKSTRMTRTDKLANEIDVSVVGGEG